MNNLTEHAKTILRALADGKALQEQMDIDIWGPTTVAQALDLLRADRARCLRIRSCSINGQEFGAPNAGPTDFVLNIQAGPEGYIFCFHAGKDRDTAYQAIVDALEGKNHA